jgi:sulfotransferase
MLGKVHFISGLPRSGATLVAAILKQNPKFRADMTSPVASLCVAVHQKIGGTGEFSVLFDDARCAQMLRGIVDSYYAHAAPGSVVFDTNRTWTAHAALLGVLYPGCRIICCVREIGWIIDSIERMRVKNPLKLSRIFTQQTGESIYTRVDALMNSEQGMIGTAWSSLREAWFSEGAGRLLVLSYDTLVNEPARTLRRLYRELGEPWYEHDFRNVEYEAPEYDASLGMPGLHTVRKVVERRAREPVIPPDLFAKYSRSHFWDNPELNPRGVTIL